MTYDLPDALAALQEIRRVLADSGRLVLFTGTSELRATPAAPEPIGRRLHFYTDEELSQLSLAAGFSDARVEHPTSCSSRVKPVFQTSISRSSAMVAGAVSF